jgi:adenosine deaminase
VQRLAQQRIPLTVCPLSNLKLCVVQNLAEHPLKRLLDAGLCVTVNADDPAYFGGYMNDNLCQTAAALGLSTADIIQLARNSFEASFITPAQRAEMMQKLELYLP